MHQNFHSKQYMHQKLQTKLDQIIIEEPLRIHLNGQAFCVIMRTPGNDKELIYGLLYSEKIINHKEEIVAYEELFESGKSSPYAITIRLKDEIAIPSNQSLLQSSSCGLCGKKELDSAYFDKPIVSDQKLHLSKISNLFEQFNQQQKSYQVTGGCHGVGLFNKNHYVVSCFEDIGRHNALDKIIGHQIINGKDENILGVLLSGRISFEMLYKVYRAQWPFILAVSSPSSLVIEFAEKYHMTIIGFCRDHRATVYSGLEKVYE